MSLIVFIFLFTFNLCTTTNTLTQKDEYYWAMYEKWLGGHNKTYNLEEKQRRFHNFQATVRRIDYHNSNNESSGYKLGLNQFADLSEKEYEANILCSGSKDFTTVNSVPYDPTDNPSAVNLPNSIDWRKLNAISPIKNQGECGSCWAFSSVSSVESLTFLVMGRLTQLSEQELVDCDTYSRGCGGGSAWKGLGFILRNGGINSAEAYPYTGVTGNCNEAKKNVKVASIVGFRWVAQNNTNALINAVAFQPAVSVVVDAT